MEDVARLAAVSTKTVSRVVNGEAYVSGETAARVRQAIIDLGFRRNDMAHILRKQVATSAIGLMIEDLANPFYAAIARAAEEVAHEHGCVLIVGSSEEDPARERYLVGSLLRRRVDGLLIVPTGEDHGFLATELRGGPPVVFVDRPAHRIDADVVLLDNFRGAADAVGHLLRGGHRRIALISGDSTVWTGAERLRGYRAAFDAAGVPIEAGLLVEGCTDVASAERAVERLLAEPDPPTALFAANNRGAIGALRAVGRSGRDVEVIGFDDFELAELLAPPVTVVGYDPSAVGRTAAELLFSRMAGVTDPPRRVTIPVHLVQRPR